MKLVTMVIIILGVLPGITAWSAPAVYSPAAAEELDQLPQLKTISQYGITRTFEKPVRVGQFVNGDYYVVGPLTVTNIDPRPLIGAEVPESELVEAEKERIPSGKFIRNGSMLNPPAKQEVAYDTGIRNYSKPELVAVPPTRLRPGDSLVSTISLRVEEKSQFPYHNPGKMREQHDNSPVKTAAILTCVAEPQPSDAFRPSYSDRQQKVYLARNLKRDLLPKLKPPANTQTSKPGSAFINVLGLTPVSLVSSTPWRTCRITVSGWGRLSPWPG